MRRTNYIRNKNNKTEKNVSWSCTECTSVSSSGIDQLKALIMSLQTEVKELKALIDKQASTSQSFHFEEVVQEVFDRNQRKNNLIIYGVQENQSLQTSADRQTSIRTRQSEYLRRCHMLGILEC
nr:unnamed protein product [Callosobruchus analis]